MTKLTVIEPEDGTLTRQIKENLQSRNAAHEINVAAASPHGKISRGCDIVVVSPYCGETCAADNASNGCGFFLLPGGFRAPDGAKCVVTYGMSPKSTITLSSIGERSCVLALQRELVTAAGAVIDRQELKVNAAGRADDILAVSGTMLLLGLMP